MPGDQRGFYHLPEILTVGAGDNGFLVSLAQHHRISLTSTALIEGQCMRQIEPGFVLRHPLRDFDAGDLPVQP